MFASKLNNLTGKMEWEFLNEDYDYQQELARAGFADMLHDYERNQKYYEGLKKVIGKLKAENKHVHVLDIGTGTGLLSMMAVACGADKVTAVEAFKPMIQVAKNCLKSNGMHEKVKIIEKRSTEIIFGVDMFEKANVLVTEVFDTELIGEGAISTFTHALENLLEKDCHVIPDHAFMYVQVVESEICRDLNWLNMDGINLKIPLGDERISGDFIYDIQLTEFNKFKEIIDPTMIFKFCFSGVEPLPFSNHKIVKLTAKNNGLTHAVFMWWVLYMDKEEEIILSCAPKWAHHNPNNMQWRDHWMQAIYFPTNYLSVEKNENFSLSCNHDEYSLWFEVAKEKEILNDQEPNVTLSLVSRNRLLQINDIERNQRFLNIFKQIY